MTPNHTAIEICKLGKRYRLGQRQAYQTLRESIYDHAAAPLRLLRRLRGKTEPAEPTGWTWAMRDVSLRVNHGEVVGVIGRNGAGKSTLLKMLCGITEPTEGYADVFGRVGSLLEVGTGFHPELTGRENIFMNGALLGMRRNEIKRKFDEIVAFSEVEKFLDTPVKHYSSGMYMRLAFAVAAHLEPEILLVDEVLAVGDAAFQKKCLGKMGDVARGGRTILFVSHNMAAVQALCSRTVWLHEGKVKADGRTNDVVQQYFKSAVSLESTPLSMRQDRTGDGTVRIRDLKIEDLEGSGVIRTNSRLKISVEYAAEKPVLHPRVYASVYDVGHAGLYALDSESVGGLPETLPPEGVLTCVTDPIRLTAGRCYVNLGFLKGGSLADRVEYAAYFDVEPDNTHQSGRLPERSWVLCVLGHSWSANGHGVAR
jgi:lipopolysaccharide transport system ATP-binding protein